MIQRRAAVGLALLSALALCAFAAQSASATKAINTTTFTCIPEPEKKGDFKDEHCDETDGKKEGAFTHSLIPVGTSTKVDATNEKVTESTKKSEPGILVGTVNLVKTEIECAAVKGNTAKSSQENSEPIKGQHTFTGSAVAEFSSCTVRKPAKCTIKEPLVTEGTFEGVEGLEGPKGEKNAMGVQYRGAGGGETFGEIQYQGAECSLREKGFGVKGSVIGTSGPTTESGQENKEAGATITLTPKFKMQSLQFGGNPAEFTLIIVPKMAEVEGKKGNPISITTTT